MQDLENLIQTIIVEGTKKAKKIVDDANSEADKIMSAANEKEKEFISTQVDQIKAENENRLQLAKNSTIYRLNKQLLKEKNEIIERVFTKLKQNFLKLDDEQYESFLSAALDKADVGDEVNYSAKPGEAKRISNLAVFKQKGLRLGKVVNISGGVILSNAVCNKDLSFEGLIKEKRENSIRHVAGLLFG